MSTEEAEQIVQAAARTIVNAALDLIQADPHQWGNRGCGTCRAVSALVGRDFGCVRYEKEGATLRAQRRVVQ